MPHTLLIYELAEDYVERRPAFRDEHLAYAWAAADAGTLILAGPVGDPPESALLIFSDSQAAEDFAGGDPYVREGLIVSWRTAPWITVVGKDAATPVRPG